MDQEYPLHVSAQMQELALLRMRKDKKLIVEYYLLKTRELSGTW